MANLIFIGSGTKESKEVEELIRKKTKDFLVLYLNEVYLDIRRRPILIDTVNEEVFIGLGRIVWFLENRGFMVFNELITEKERMKEVLTTLK